jgi:hypothetical protein
MMLKGVGKDSRGHDGVETLALMLTLEGGTFGGDRRVAQFLEIN